MPFRRDGDVLVATFTIAERALLVDLMDQLIGMLDERTTEDPAIARLLPNAYADDRDSAAEFRRYTEDGLVERKIANARALRDSLDDGPIRIDPDLLQSWLRSLTDVRLVLAARLGIELDDDEGTGDPFLSEVYQWLGYVQSSILSALED